MAGVGVGAVGGTRGWWRVKNYQYGGRPGDCFACSDIDSVITYNHSQVATQPSSERKRCNRRAS